jgi:hypothetical protein
MILLRKTQLKNRLYNIINKDYVSEDDAWKALDEIETYIINHKTYLRKHPRQLQDIEDCYIELMIALSDNLGQISRQLFIELDNMFNTKSGSRSPKSHQACANASENIAIKIISDILSKEDASHRALIIMRYAMIAKMRIDNGDYQSAEFIIMALSSYAVNETRLKQTYAELPPAVIKLIYSLELISLKPDSHVMTYRTKPIIPSLARIKKLVTFASDEAVSLTKRQAIRDLLVTIQYEVADSKKKRVEEALSFFDIDTLKNEPIMSLEDFNQEMYDISVNSIERRDAKPSKTRLFTQDFSPLADIDLTIKIDKKMDTYLKMKEAHKTLKSLHEQILSLIDELNTIHEAMKDSRKNRVRKAELEGIIHYLERVEVQANANDDIDKIDDLINYLHQKSAIKSIRNYHLHHGLQRFVDATTLADKLNELIDVLNKVEYTKLVKNKIEIKYAELEISNLEITAADVKLNASMKPVRTKVLPHRDVARITNITTEHAPLANLSSLVRQPTGEKVKSYISLFETRVDVPTIERPPIQLPPKRNDVKSLIKFFNPCRDEERKMTSEAVTNVREFTVV